MWALRPLYAYAKLAIAKHNRILGSHEALRRGVCARPATVTHLPQSLGSLFGKYLGLFQKMLDASTATASSTALSSTTTSSPTGTSSASDAWARSFSTRAHTVQAIANMLAANSSFGLVSTLELGYKNLPLTDSLDSRRAEPDARTRVAFMQVGPRALGPTGTFWSGGSALSRRRDALDA